MSKGNIGGAFSTDTNNINNSYYFKDVEKPIQVFRSLRDFEKHVTLSEIRVDLNEKIVLNTFWGKIYANENIKNVLMLFPPTEVQYFNNQGKLVIGKYLYNIDSNRLTKIDLFTNKQTSTELESDQLQNLIIEDPGDGGGGGGGGTTTEDLPGWDCSGDFSSSNYSDVSRQCFFAQDSDNNQWQLQFYWGNQSWTTPLGLRKASAWTKVLFYYPSSGIWGGKPNNASNLFPNTSVKVSMHFNARLGLDVSCKNHTKSTTSNFSANREYSRCANTGVTSHHWIQFMGSHYLIESYMP